ncbi:MAG: cytochrome b [Novosphingobium sp.]|nr:cytochrome b [Novosphingobium sp.]
MNQKRYSGVAMLLHWTIAIAVIANWRIADSAEGLPDAERAAVMANHMALGIVILVLTLARLAWRIAKKPPPFAASVKPWEARLAHITHVVFYALLIGLPLGGWLATSFYGRGIGMWGLFAVPALPVAADENLGHSIFEAHATAGTAMLALIVLHTLGALKHTLVDRDGNLFRMLPFGTSKV